MKKWILLSAIIMVIASCDKQKRECPEIAERAFALDGFSKIDAGEAFNLIVDKGDNFSVKAYGCSDDLSDLDIEVMTGGILSIKYRNYDRDRYRIDFRITLPRLTSFSLSGAATASVNGFGGQNSVIRNVLSGASKCTMIGTGINAQVELSGASVLTLSGNTESLYGNISGASYLHSFGVDAKEVDIAASGASKAYVKPLEVFFAEASGDSRVFYRGNPTTTNIVTSGNGKVIKE